MPYPNEHSCRLRDPGDFEKDSFRRITQGKLVIIIAKLKGKDTTTAQAYRYPKDDWDQDEAKKHCKDNGGSFEPASGESQLPRGDIEMRKNEDEKVAKLKESLVPWKAKVRLAKPDASGKYVLKNGYEYPEDVLKNSVTKWVNLPITTEHSIDCGKLVGITTNAVFGKDGLYAEGVGLMDKDLADKLSGLPDKSIPALIKGVSMGANGELIDVEGKDVPQIDGETYEPLEWTFTPFPAMPDAQVVEFAALKESLKPKGIVKKVKDELEKLVGKQKEETTIVLVEPQPTQAAAEIKLTEGTKPAEKLTEITMSTPEEVAGIEKQVKELEGKTKTETEAKPTEPKPLETVKPTESPTWMAEVATEVAKLVREAVKAEIQEYTQLTAKKIVETKPKGVSTAVNPPEPPRFETVQDIVNFVKDLRDAKDESNRPKYSTRDAWKIACMEVFEQAQNE